MPCSDRLTRTAFEKLRRKDAQVRALQVELATCRRTSKAAVERLQKDLREAQRRLKSIANMASGTGQRKSAASVDDAGWKRVAFAVDCVGDDCGVCGGAFDFCDCPGPMQKGYEYRERDGVLEARPTGNENDPPRFVDEKPVEDSDAEG